MHTIKTADGGTYEAESVIRALRGRTPTFVAIIDGRRSFLDAVGSTVDGHEATVLIDGAVVWNDAEVPDAPEESDEDIEEPDDGDSIQD